MRFLLSWPASRQKLAVGLILAGILMTCSWLAWRAHQQVATARSQLAAAEENLRDMSALVERYRESQRGAVQVDDSDLVAVVNRSLQGRSFQPSRIQQQNGELALRIDNAAFSDLVQWLMTLEESGVLIANVAIGQGPTSGASATLALRTRQRSQLQ